MVDFWFNAAKPESPQRFRARGTPPTIRQQYQHGAVDPQSLGRFRGPSVILDCGTGAFLNDWHGGSMPPTFIICNKNVATAETSC